MSFRLLGIQLRPITYRAVFAAFLAFAVAYVVGRMGQAAFDAAVNVDVLTLALSVMGGALAATLGVDIRTQGWRAGLLVVMFVVPICLTGVVIRALVA